MFKQVLCFLTFNHVFTTTSIEEGQGSDFRYVKTCFCGNRKDVDNWTDDNHELGYGSN